MVWTFLLRTKDEAFSKFKDWKVLIENQTDKKIKALRTDNGMEFCNTAFDDLCAESGILRHRSVRFTPQQNGVAERMNRTLLEKVRSLLISSGLPKGFWGEALATATYLVNRSPNRALNFKCPLEIWSGKPLSLNHLRVFGCAAYAHNREGKLDPRALKCIFLGYQTQDGTKGYRLWEYEARGVKIVVSRDVTFNELEFPYKKHKAIPDSNHSLSEPETEIMQIGIPIEPNHTEIGADVPTGQGYIDLEPAVQEIEDQGEGTVTGQNETPPSPQMLEPSASETLANYQLARDRERRDFRPNPRYNSFAELVFSALVAAQELIQPEPCSYDEAMSSKDKAKWVEAMNEEMDSLKLNKTWILVPKPRNQKLVSCKWIFKIKEGLNSSDPPRLVAKGFTQKEGIDYTEIFSPVVKFKTIRIMLSIAACSDLEIEQLDVKTAFLHGELDETIYMRQPEGYVDSKFPDHACLLKKSLYGLKQSPRQWYLKFYAYVLKLGFTRSAYDSCFYFHVMDRCSVFILLYVDDMLLVCKSLEVIAKLKCLLSKAFDMKDLGPARKILGMVIERNRKLLSLKVHQKGYLEKVVSKFGELTNKVISVPLASHFILDKTQCPVTRSETAKMLDVPYANALGSLMYAMISTRPDLCYAMSLLSRFMSNPGYEHWLALRHVLAYVKCTLNVGLNYGKRVADNFLVGYVDADFAGDRDDRKSTSAYFFTVGSNLVSWKSQLQSLVALSSTESEYVAICEAVKECVWLSGFLREINMSADVPVLFTDSNSALLLSKNPVYHERSKHIAVKFHFVRDMIAKGSVNLCKIDTDLNPADFGTKIVSNNKFKLCLDLLHVM